MYHSSVIHLGESNQKTIEKPSDARDISKVDEGRLSEVVEVKLQIQRKYLASAEEICRLEGDSSLESWLSDVLESGIEAELDHTEQLGLTLSRNLKRRYGFVTD